MKQYCVVSTMEERRDRVNERAVFNPIHVYLRDFVTRLPSALYRALNATLRDPYQAPLAG